MKEEIVEQEWRNWVMHHKNCCGLTLTFQKIEQFEKYGVLLETDYLRALKAELAKREHLTPHQKKAAYKKSIYYV